VVITGPVASGKNAAAEGLARLAREQGLTAAAIDLDALVFMVNGPDWLQTTPEHWRLARKMAASMADALIADGMHLVVLAGPFFTQESRYDLVSQLRVAPKPPFVMLHVSLEESYRRIEGSPMHVVTKDRELTRRLYESIEWDKQPDTDIVIETDGLTPDQVLEQVALRLTQAV
jgi:hypothetical protein